MIKIVFIFLNLIFINFISAQNKIEKFIYIKSSEVNLRAGPSKQYAIKWIIKSKNEPVILITEFEEWIKVKDIDGEEGWINKSSISHNNIGAIVVKDYLIVYARPQATSKKIAKLEKRVRIKLKKCIDLEWCSISIGDIKGWVKINGLWGVNKKNDK